MPTSPPQRKPHYEQRPQGRIEIWPRDEQILYDVFRYRLLRSRHILALSAGSPQWIRRRLRRLYDHDFLYRLYEPLHRRKRFMPGSQPKIYALSTRGADVLAESHGIYRGTRINWHEKNTGIGDDSIKHTLAIADAVVPIEAATRQRDDILFIDGPELIAAAPEATRKKAYPYTWRVTVPGTHRAMTLGITPDKFFGVRVLSRPEGRNRRHFFVEADRSTEPTHRRGLSGQTSIVKKLLCYGETDKQKLHRDVYGISGFRVLIVTTSPTRIANMIAQVARLAAERGYRPELFFFTDYTSLAAAADIFALRWQNGRGAWVTLVD
jgi:hypothetical protein